MTWPSCRHVPRRIRDFSLLGAIVQRPGWWSAAKDPGTSGAQLGPLSRRDGVEMLFGCVKGGVSNYRPSVTWKGYALKRQCTWMAFRMMGWNILAAVGW